MTEFFIGKRTAHSYALENVSYGTANTASEWSWMGVVQSITPNSKSEILAINAMDSDTDSRNVSDYIETLRTYGCTVEFLLQHCRPLVLAWGDDTMTGSDPYTHTITETNTLPSFSLNFGYQHTTDHAVDYLGCVVNRMDIACAKGEFVRCTMEVVAQKSEDHDFRSYRTSDAMKKYITVGTPSAGVGKIVPYMYSDAAITINGTTYEAVDSVRMTINNNLLAEPVLDNSDDSNDKRISEPIPQVREYEVTMTVRMATDDLYDLWDAGTYIPDDPTVTFQRSVNDKVVFTLESAQLESAISPFKISDGIVLVELPMKVKKISPVETNSLGVSYDTAEGDE